MVATPQSATSASIPSAQEAKDAICDLIAAAGGVFRGKVRLHKAFYFDHLFYWREGEGVLTDHPVVRAPQGPFIDHAEWLLRELKDDGIISIGSAPVGPFQETVYRLEAPRSIDMNSARGRAIRQAVELVDNRTAVELSELTHQYSVSWQTTDNGREMDIYLDLLAEDEIARMQQEIAEFRRSGGDEA